MSKYTDFFYLYIICITLHLYHTWTLTAHASTLFNNSLLWKNVKRSKEIAYFKENLYKSSNIQKRYTFIKDWLIVLFLKRMCRKCAKLAYKNYQVCEVQLCCWKGTFNTVQQTPKESRPLRMSQQVWCCINQWTKTKCHWCDLQNLKTNTVRKFLVTEFLVV